VVQPDTAQLHHPSIRWIARFRFYTLFVFTGLALAVPVLDFTRTGLKGDFWWVWNSGRWMARHHRILAENPAVWNGSALAGKPWVNLEWGWELFLYAIDPHLHPTIFIALLIAFELLMLAAFLWALKALAPTLTMEVSLALYALYSIMIFPFTVGLRAELFSYAAFPFLLGILVRGRKDWRWLAILAPLVLVWANVHGSWLMIPVLMGLEAGATLWRRRWYLALRQFILGIVVPLSVVALLTPWHLETLRYAWWLDHNPDITTYIEEWQSINFHQFTFLLIGVLVLAAWVWRAQGNRGRSPSRMLDLWFAGATLAFFDEVRMITYFGMVFALWLGAQLASQHRYGNWIPTTSGNLAQRWAPIAGAAVAIAATLVISAKRIPQWTAPSVPPAVVSWISHHGHHVVLGPINDGGYLEAHGVHHVFADGRADFFLDNGHRFQDYVALVVNQTTTPRQSQRIISTQRISLVVWPTAEVPSNLGWFMTVHHWLPVYHRGAWTVYRSSTASR